jgi:ABC-type glycerol-3-phosphate transport system substrate-binding protein
MFQLPPDNSGGKNTVASIGFSLSVGANAATKHPAEVRKFLNYAADANVNYTWATNAGSIAPLNAKKGLFPPYYANSAKPLAKAGRLSLNQNIQIPNPGFFAALQNTVIGLFTGQLTLNGALADLDAKWPAP